jgi:di/tricarboxylate transporter
MPARLIHAEYVLTPMTNIEDQVVIAVLLAGTLVLFAWGRLRYDLVAVLALLASVGLGVVPAGEAFSGFGHPAVITVAAVLGLSRALQLSGVVGAIASQLGKLPRGRTVQTAANGGVVVLLSAFMNNVGAIALMLPVVMRIATRCRIQPSYLLMPIAFASLLGGLCTLIGTPPNVIIATSRQAAVGTPFGMFDFAPIGVTLSVVGLAFIVLVGWRWLPARQGASNAQHDAFKIDEYLAEFEIPEQSDYVDRPLAELESISEGDFAVVALLRGRRRQVAPNRRERLHAGDVLVVEADSDTLQQLRDQANLVLLSAPAKEPMDLHTDGSTLVEAVVRPQGRADGSTANRLRLRARYRLNLLGVARHGERLETRVGQVVLRAGDVLLLQGVDETMPQALAALGCVPLAERDLPLATSKTYVTPAIFAAGIVAAATGFMPVELAFTGALSLIVLFRLLPIRELYESIDWSVIVLLAAMLPVGKALETTGAAGSVADIIALLDARLPASMLVGLLIVLSMALSNVVNNAATAVLMAPIAIDLAIRLSASPDPFLMAVAVGSSCAFVTPIGHQSNLLVMGPGGYQFGDYWPLGLPLSVLIAIVAALLIPLVWPF